MIAPESINILYYYSTVLNLYAIDRSVDRPADISRILVYENGYK